VEYTQISADDEVININNQSCNSKIWCAAPSDETVQVIKMEDQKW